MQEFLRRTGNNLWDAITQVDYTENLKRVINLGASTVSNAATAALIVKLLKFTLTFVTNDVFQQLNKEPVLDDNSSNSIALYSSTAFVIPILLSIWQQYKTYENHRKETENFHLSDTSTFQKVSIAMGTAKSVGLCAGILALYKVCGLPDIPVLYQSIVGVFSFGCISYAQYNAFLFASKNQIQDPLLDQSRCAKILHTAIPIIASFANSLVSSFSVFELPIPEDYEFIVATVCIPFIVIPNYNLFNTTYQRALKLNKEAALNEESKFEAKLSWKKSVPVHVATKVRSIGVIYGVVNLILKTGLKVTDKEELDFWEKVASLLGGVIVAVITDRANKVVMDAGKKRNIEVTYNETPSLHAPESKPALASRSVISINSSDRPKVTSSVDSRHSLKMQVDGEPEFETKDRMQDRHDRDYVIEVDTATTVEINGKTYSKVVPVEHLGRDGTTITSMMIMNPGFPPEPSSLEDIKERVEYNQLTGEIVKAQEEQQTIVVAM